MDRTAAQITAIACGWVGQKKVNVWLLGQVSELEVLTAFRSYYDQSDQVTGHYLVGHDLSLVNGRLMRYHLPPLEPKLVQDTCSHFKKKKDLSKSLENLAAMYGLETSKQHMSQHDWEEANTLVPEGLRKTRERVVSDVVLQRMVRAKMLEFNHLNGPRWWRP